MQSSQPPRSTSTSGTPSKIPLNGLFRNGVWHCNCSPRLPAIQFTAKRDTPNRGRTFYTCQLKQGKENKCDFFLWSEEARARELGSVLSNSRTEGETPSRRNPKKQITLHESITPRKEKRHWTEKTPVSGAAEMAGLGITRADSGGTTQSSSTLKASTITGTRGDGLYDNGSSSDEDEVALLIDASSQASITEQKSPSAGSKRKRLDEDEYSDFSSAEEEELVLLTDRSSKGRYHDALSTPAAATQPATAADAMPTPFTEKPVRRVLFALPEDSSNSAKRQRTDDSSGPAAHPNRRLPPPSGPPPSSSSFSTSSSSPSSSQQHQTGTEAPTPRTETNNLTSEVMDLLRGQKIDEPALRAVRAALDRLTAKARGFERGRDAARDAVRRAEARAAKLQHRITELELARVQDAEARKKMRSEIMRVYCES